MAIQHMDNFAIYGGNKTYMLNGIYAENAGASSDYVALTSDPDGVTAGTVLKLQCFTAITPIVRYVLSSAQAMVGWASRFWISAIPGGNFSVPQLMSFRDNNNNEMALLTMTTTGALTFNWNGGSYTTPGPVIGATGWYHYEANYHTDNGGSFELRIEGVTVISLSNLGYTVENPVYQVAVAYNGTNFGGPQLYVKDWILYDGTGTTNNSFLGACIVYSMIPDSDVTLGGWTLNGGTSGHAILDNAPPQDDVEYINAAFPVPAPSQYTVSDLPPNVTSIKAIMPVTRARKIDGGDGQLQQSIISGGTTGAGANRPITAAYTYWRDIFEYDPNTTASWTVAATNAVNLKLDRTL